MTENPERERAPRSRPVTILFLLALVAVPVAQAAWELRRGESVQALEVFGPLESERLRAFDDELRERSFLQRVAVRWYQAFAVRWLRRGNQKAVLGRDGWLYYRDDLDYVTRPSSVEGAGRAAVVGIETFRDQLAERGIPLLVVPLLPKGMIDPEWLSGWTADLDLVEVADADRFHAALAARGIDALDVRPLLRAATGEPAYLPQDTHWTPATMKRIAAAIAAAVEERLASAPAGPLERRARWAAEAAEVRGLGDIVNMLQLPERAQPYAPMRLAVERVLDAETGAPFAPDPTAEVLLLGDSFTRVFSDPKFGLGAGAGLGEHLAAELGAPLDVIALAGGSSRAVRESLARRPGGLDGKRIVVWQISLREVAGDPEAWGRVELPARDAGTPEAGAGTGERLVAEARVTEVSRVPDGFDYDFCLAVVEYEVERVVQGAHPAGEPLWVGHVAMIDFERTAADGLAVGDRVRLELEPLERHHDLEETSWVDDTDAGLTIWFPTAWERIE